MKLTHDDVKQAVGNNVFGALSTAPMGGREFLRKGLNGKQRQQTAAACAAVKAPKTKAPDFDGTIAAQWSGATANERKAVSLMILCGRIPAWVKDGIGISGPTVDAESLSVEKREGYRALRAALAEYYSLDELRRLYPRRKDGVRVSGYEHPDGYDDDAEAPETVPVSTDVSDSGGLE